MKLRTAFLLTLLALALSACGPRGSGYAPADNAVTASPDKDIDLEPHAYTLPPAEPRDGLSNTYATGDSSGGDIYKMSTIDVDTLPISTGDAHGDEGGHGEEAEHGSEEAEHSTDEDHSAEVEDAEHDAEEDALAETSSEDEADMSETEESAEEGEEDAEEDETEEASDMEDSDIEASAESLEFMQARSSDLSQQLRDLGDETDSEEASTLRRDLLRAQGDVASSSDVRGTYVIQEGDTLEDVSNAFYGDAEGGEAILEANRYLLDDDSTLFPGLVLLIPSRDSSTVMASGAEAEETSELESEEATDTSEESSEDSQDDSEEDAEQEDTEEDAEASSSEESPEETTDSSEVMAQASDFDWQELGDATYTANCIACHQGNGEGIPGAFPPLAGGHMPELYNAEGGRDYIINVVLYGLMGEIDVNGTTYNGVMTPWGQLSDEQIAATLNHELTSWGNDASLEDFSPIMPDEVAALRDQGLSSADVLELRPQLP